MKKMIMHVIHHSHTDVGYTDTQEKMRLHHIGFIEEVVNIIRTEPRFKWNCESYWCVSQFLRCSSKEYIDDFVKFVKSGNICISGSYLNITDLASAKVLSDIMKDCVEELAKHGLQLKVAMTADINGYSWGFADVLYDSGVRGLLSCIHTHHGYHPLFRKQTPFYWKTPKGNRLLAWNGEHYLFGNELGIAQAAEFEYTLQDGLSWAGLSSFEKAKTRIKAFVDGVREQGYEYDFITVGVSGNMTDNSPPSLKVLEFIDRYNSEVDDGIELKMSTLTELFKDIEGIKDIPEYSGDWTDWWADGVGSTPMDVAHYRAALRKYSVARKLDPQYRIADKRLYDEALYNLMFYSEHTWGYSSSITEPFHPQVNNLDQWKRLYVLKANENATIICERIQQHYGETQISLHKELKFKAVNPHSFAVKDMLVIDLEHFYGHSDFDVVDERTGENIPFQISRYSRGPQMCILLDLQSREEKVFSLVERQNKKLSSAGLCAMRGIEGVSDLSHVINSSKNGRVFVDGMENDFFKITFSVPHGITSIFDKKNNRELVKKNCKHFAFTPIYEVTPLALGEDYLTVRRNMGRNRKAVRTNRSIGKLSDVRVLESGELFLRAELVFNVDGAKVCSVVVTAYKHFPRITVDLRMQKSSVWEPENFYLSLPFALPKSQMYIDKAGAVLRPRIDQLPGTCVDFYAVQNGAAFIGETDSLVLTAQDTPLFCMGALEMHEIKLMGENVSNSDDLYSWVMNNFWETNFKANLGGFYQFRYNLDLVSETNPTSVFEKAEAINEGVLTFYSFLENKK